MRKGILVTALAVVMLVIGFGSAKDTDAAFHLMRVYGGMGGAFGDTNIQYVELRQTFSGQNFVGGHDICFYDATGAPYAKFRFAANVSNGTMGASIMVGSSEFDAAWAAGSPDVTFNGSNMTQIAPMADIFHPIRLPAGKISFGTELASMPAAMCQAQFFMVDSVAYGTGYTGTVDWGTKFNTDMPSSGSQAVRLTGPFCNPCSPPPDNSTNYSILDVNMAGSEPRNNMGQAGPISAPDTDGDGVSDLVDLCASTAPAAPVDANGCSQVQVDSDTDGICNSGAPSAGPSPGCTGSDNCRYWANPTQVLPDWFVPAADSDCDGYPDTVTAGVRGNEAYILTDGADHCTGTPVSNDEGLPDAWPPDFQDNQLVNGADFLVMNPVFGKHTDDPGFSVRFDLSANGVINGQDVLEMNPFFGKRCQPLP